jgi:malonyl-CoA/methylmalonyl-CoA synthetase
MSLAAALARPSDGASAIEDATGSWCWGEIRQRAARVAQHLSGAEGARIGLLVEPGADWLGCLLGIGQAGACAVPLSPKQPDRELGALLADAGATMLLISERWRRKELPIRQRSVESLRDEPPHAGGPHAGPPHTPRTPWLMLYTSGTTARPKGAMLSDAALGHQAASLGDAWQLSAGTRLLHALPLHHMHGIAIALLPCLAAGGQVHMLPRFDADAVWEAASAANTFMGVPTMYARLLDALEAADEPSASRYRAIAAALPLWVSGSAALPARTARAWRALSGAIPLERYGMTETGVICSNPLAPDGRREGSVGRLLPGFDARVVDDTGATLPASGRGSLWLRGPSLFDGYWQRGDVRVDGWFETGDEVARDDEGRIRILGRRSVDILKSGGTKLSALEIEEALREHPAVVEVAVVGLPDEDRGQLVVAAVVTRSDVSDEELSRFVGEQLAQYKVPRRYVRVDELPRNALGKVTKVALAEQLSADRMGG